MEMVTLILIILIMKKKVSGVQVTFYSDVEFVVCIEKKIA